MRDRYSPGYMQHIPKYEWGPMSSGELRHHLRLKRSFELRKAWLRYIVRGPGRAKGDALAALGIFDATYNYGHQVHKYQAAQRRWRAWRGFQ